MSMLSAQCDELRERAKVLRQGRWSDGADDARLMEDAADTIWELRGMVHKERAEADRLREELEAEHTLAETLGHCHEHAQAENERLRELVASVWRLFTEHGAVHPSDLPEVDAVRNDMRELGVEVDDG